jgi:integrase
MITSVLPFRFKAAGRSPVSLYVDGLTPAGRRSQLYWLRRAARFFGFGDLHGAPWHELRFSHMADFRNHLLGQGCAPNTINAGLVALAGVARMCFMEGTMSAEDYTRLKLTPRVKGESEPPGRALEDDEIARIFEACAADTLPTRGVRDTALFSVFFGTGVRCFEAAGLLLDDYNPRSGALRVKGKGRHVRIVYVPEDYRPALDAWLALRGTEPGHLFVAVSKHGTIFKDMRRTGRQGIYYTIYRVRAAAGLDHFTTHDCRRTLISTLLDRTDLQDVQLVAGHKDPKTTMKYDRRKDRRVEAASRLVKKPRRRPAAEGVDTPAGGEYARSCS